MRDRIIRGHLRRSVVVTLKSGAAFHGILFDADRESVVLRDAASIDPNVAGPTPVDGELLVLRGDLAYLQFT